MLLGHVYAFFVESCAATYYGRNQTCPAMESIAWDVIRCPALVFTCCQFGKKLVLQLHGKSRVALFWINKGVLPWSPIGEKHTASVYGKYQLSPIFGAVKVCII